MNMRLLCLLGLMWLLSGCFVEASDEVALQAPQINIMTGTPRPNIADDRLHPALQGLTAFALPSATVENVQVIYAHGQAIGNRAGVFSKVGDSMTVSRNFMYALGVGAYDLADHAYLQTTLSHYLATETRGGNAFAVDSVAAGEGWIGSSVFQVNNANAAVCAPNETPIVCEYRVMRPSVAIIMFGTNDAGYRSDTQFYEDMTAIVTFTEELGIIPLLTTMPNRPDVPQRVLALNDILRDIATERNLPLIDLYALTIDLPNYGLTYDDVHLSTPSGGVLNTATFDDVHLQYGYTVRNLATLQALAVLQVMLES